MGQDVVQEATIPLSTRLFSAEKVLESHLPSKSTNLYLPLSGIYPPKPLGWGSPPTIGVNGAALRLPEIYWMGPAGNYQKTPRSAFAA